MAAQKTSHLADKLQQAVGWLRRETARLRTGEPAAAATPHGRQVPPQLLQQAPTIASLPPEAA